jgi:hypothetical protein
MYIRHTVLKLKCGRGWVCGQLNELGRRNVGCSIAKQGGPCIVCVA